MFVFCFCLDKINKKEKLVKCCIYIIIYISFYNLVVNFEGLLLCVLYKKFIMLEKLNVYVYEYIFL